MVDNINRNNRRGSGFTNIGKYLQANKQNRLGAAIGSGIKDKSEEAEEEAGQVSSGFQTEANKSTVTDEDRAESERIQGLFSDSSGFQGLAEADEETGQVGDVETVKGFLNTAYKGPTDISKEQKESLDAKSAALSQFGGSTRTAQGRESLLKRFAGGKDYTSGQQKLDNLLLGKTGTQDLEQARKDTTGAIGDISRISKGAKGLGEQYKQEASNFAKGTEDAFRGIGTGIRENVQGSAEARLDALSALRNSSRDYTDASVGQSERDALEALGLYDSATGEGSKYLYGAGDPASQERDLVSGEYNLGEEDLAKVRTLEQGRKLGALNQLFNESDVMGGYQTNTLEDTPDEAVGMLKSAMERGKGAYDQQIAGLDTTALEGHMNLYRNTPGYEQGRTLGHTGSGYDHSPYFRAQQDTYKFLQEKMGFTPNTYKGYYIGSPDTNSLTLKQVDQMKEQWDQSEASRISSEYDIY